MPDHPLLAKKPRSFTDPEMVQYVAAQRAFAQELAEMIGRPIYVQNPEATKTPDATRPR